MSASTARHARETTAKAAKTMHISAEQARRARVVMQTFVDGKEALQRGEYSVNELYKLAKNDNRVGLHILIPPELRDRIRQVAKENKVKANDLLTNVLTKIFWYEGERGSA